MNAKTLIPILFVVLVLAALGVSVLPHQPVPPISIPQSKVQAYVADVAKPLPAGKEIDFYYGGSMYDISYHCSDQRNVFFLWKATSLLKYASYPCTTDGLTSFVEFLKKSFEDATDFFDTLDTNVADFVARLH